MRKLSVLLGGAAAAGLAALLCVAPPAVAQGSGGALAGRAADEQGGSLPGVSVTVKSTSTGLTRTVPTGSDGSYRFASLIADTYDVTAALSGFKTVEEKGVVVNVASTRTLNLTMSVAGATATVTVTPGAPAPPDGVAITNATWDARLLTIEATSTNPNAILSVYSSSGAFMFTLTNQGGGRYFDERGWVTNPEVITVRSNLGGSATATLTNNN